MQRGARCCLPHELPPLAASEPQPRNAFPALGAFSARFTAHTCSASLSA